MDLLLSQVTGVLPVGSDAGFDIIDFNVFSQSDFIDYQTEAMGGTPGGNPPPR
ncbi:hypothetical protein V8J88_01615 [Massilia sp. W12]|uniref:hypothetical protein n=1 Tax=Massilia sp. W12 TaxID=3126507 RepID=UPI0030D3B238